MAALSGLSSRETLLVAIVVSLVVAASATGAEMFSGAQGADEALSFEMTVVEIPDDAARRFAIPERLADLGLVLSDAEASKLAEFRRQASRPDPSHVTFAQTSVGRSAVLHSAGGGRRVACLVMAESVTSEGNMTLRVVPLVASRSAAEIAADGHAAMFAVTRTFATVQLNRGEAMMFGGWKSQQDPASTIVAIVKPKVVESPRAVATGAASGSQSRVVESAISVRNQK